MVDSSMGGFGDGLLSPCEGDWSPSSSSEVGSSSSFSSGSFNSVSGRLLTNLPCYTIGFKTTLMDLRSAPSHCWCMSRNLRAVAKGILFSEATVAS